MLYITHIRHPYNTHIRHPYKAPLYGSQYITVYKVYLFLISQINFDSDCEVDNFVPIFFFSWINQAKKGKSAVR